MADPASERAFLSTRPIPARERLIVALDVPEVDEALALVDRLGDAVWFYKLGLELSMTGRYFDLLETLRKRGKRVFVDLKFFDIPATVAAAVRRLARRGADFATIHGNEAMVEAACREKGALKLLAVTALTSLDEDDFRDLGVEVSIEKLVLSRARRIVQLGCDGVISSGVEARALRQALGSAFLIVSPGIRPLERADDQKRVVTPREAFLAGADYIVVGRPIRAAADPRAAALAIQHSIGALFDAD
ncbi:MAG: orotidine-5'-phosphate decarboxylase [Myxococcales bacterium]|nr:orotidine-5'-phosphate decarboxylase [Myxococcales bacterium]MDH5567864.1 orotidine-5'-phosphate decarboxylase [Myxococcales bacterium]